jgi:hypothetical protein
VWRVVVRNDKRGVQVESTLAEVPAAQPPTHLSISAEA